MSIGNLAFYECTGLTSIISHIKELFEINENVFSSKTYITAKLYVPKNTESSYRVTPAWNKFIEILEIGKTPSDIKTVRDNGTGLTENYDLNGRRLDAPQKGANIIRMSDGTTKKVVVK